MKISKLLSSVALGVIISLGGQALASDINSNKSKRGQVTGNTDSIDDDSDIFFPDDGDDIFDDDIRDDDFVKPVGFYNWTGAKIGVIGSYNFGPSELENNADAGFDVDRGGGTIGILGNYDVQFGNWVIGAGVDVAYGFVTGDKLHDRGTTDASDDVLTEVSEDLYGFGLLRAGYAIDKILVYGTGGGAYIKQTLDYTLNPTSAAVVAPGVANQKFTSEESAVTWAAGAGVEFAISDKISARAEYLYSPYDIEHSIGSTQTYENETHNIRLGISYHFGEF